MGSDVEIIRHLKSLISEEHLSSVASVDFGTAAAATTDVLPNTTVAGVTYPGSLITNTGILRVIVSENTGVVFSLNLTRGFGTAAAATSLMPYNSGVALVANCLYLFDVPVQAGDVANFQFGAGTTVLMLDAYLVITMGP